MKPIGKLTKTAAAVVSVLAVGLPALAMAKDLAVYQVAAPGIASEQAYQLAKAFNIHPEALDREALARNSELKFLDPQGHQQIPTRVLGEGPADEEYKQTLIEALDFEAIAKIQPVDGERALHQLQAALKDVDLLPDTYKPEISHAEFEAVDKAGKPMAQARINTSVALQLFADGIPLIGPGAKISASLSPDGSATRLQFAQRTLVHGEYVPVIDPSEAKFRCEQRLRHSKSATNLEALNLTTNLVYYAPPLQLNSVQSILPHYDCGGTTKVDGEIVHLLHELIPAVDSIEYVPEATIDASAKGRDVSAKIHIEGGTPPYTVEWSANNPRFHDKTGTALSYQAQQRDGSVTEVLSAKVTDANGISTLATASIGVQSSARVEKPGLIRYFGKVVGSLLDTLIPAVRAVGGVTDFGTENAVTNEFGDLEQGFIDRMQSGGVIERFSWSGTSAWEQDFKAGADSDWIDNTDISFYVGHGYGGGFTFENTSNDDGTLDYDDATGDWGDKDLEWLALLSCQVLKDDWSGMSRFDRWKQEFDGLHMLLGFHTNAYAWSSFSGEFADNLLKSNPMQVRTAWFEATDTNQPNGVVPVVMGVYGYDGASNINDYFWGEGTVGPDIRDGDIAGYWSIKIN